MQFVRLHLHLRLHTHLILISSFSFSSELASISSSSKRDKKAAFNILVAWATDVPRRSGAPPPPVRFEETFLLLAIERFDDLRLWRARSLALVPRFGFASDFCEADTSEASSSSSSSLLLSSVLESSVRTTSFSSSPSVYSSLDAEPGYGKAQQMSDQVTMYVGVSPLTAGYEMYS
ncbi:hypothetical protein BC567DRAFT_57486 [Phyllosticta citribraziliensis]